VNSRLLFDSPEYFPPNCPKASDIPATGTYYRLVTRVPNPPDEEFVPQVTDASQFKKGDSAGSRCKDCALSVYDTETNARRRIALRGGLARFRHIATMDSAKSGGVVRLDEGQDGMNKGHTLWWIPRGPDGRSFKRFHQECIDVA
jgi:hypothetical protein